MSFRRSTDNSLHSADGTSDVSSGSVLPREDSLSFGPDTISREEERGTGRLILVQEDKIEMPEASWDDDFLEDDFLDAYESYQSGQAVAAEDILPDHASSYSETDILKEKNPAVQSVTENSIRETGAVFTTGSSEKNEKVYSRPDWSDAVETASREESGRVLKGSGETGLAGKDSSGRLNSDKDSRAANRKPAEKPKALSRLRGMAAPYENGDESETHVLIRKFRGYTAGDPEGSDSSSIKKEKVLGLNRHRSSDTLAVLPGSAVKAVAEETKAVNGSGQRASGQKVVVGGSDSGVFTENADESVMKPGHQAGDDKVVLENVIRSDKVISSPANVSDKVSFLRTLRGEDLPAASLEKKKKDRKKPLGQKRKNLSDQHAEDTTEGIEAVRNRQKNGPLRKLVIMPIISVPALILLGLTFIIIIVSVMLNFVSIVAGYMAGAAIKEKSEELTSKFDKGYDRITYLATKYGKSTEDIYSYDLHDCVLVGDHQFAAVRFGSLKNSLKGTLIYASRDTCVSESAAQRVCRDASDTECSKIVFWFGMNDILEEEFDALSFCSEYENLIKTCFNPGDREVYVLSILGPAADYPDAPGDLQARIRESNDYLEAMCIRNKGWCFVDISSFRDSQFYGQDRKTQKDEFYKLKLFPYLCTVMGTAYALGQNACFSEEIYGVYGLTPEDTLLYLIQYLYKYKNVDNIYDPFGPFKDMNWCSFLCEPNQEMFEEAWNEVYSRSSQGYLPKLYMDQQEFLAEEYYKNRIRDYLDTEYGVDLSGASYATKAAILSLTRSFGYLDGEDFKRKVVTETIEDIFLNTDWTKDEKGIITDLYDQAAKYQPDDRDRWEQEKADALALYDGTLNIYELSYNDYGYIDWRNHLFEGEEPKDRVRLATEAPTGVRYRTGTGYIVDHDETPGALAREYVNFALSFADPPENYGSGNYKLKYTWGGASLDSEIGADCSGFVGMILATYGLLDMDTAKAHGYYSSWFRDTSVVSGEFVSLDEIRIGDVLCYQHHVGIYVGNGMMVNEPDVGLGVQVQSIQLRQQLVCIRRYVQPDLPFNHVDFVGDSRIKCLGTGGDYEYNLIPQNQIHAAWGADLQQWQYYKISRDVEPGAKQAFFWLGINDIGRTNDNHAYDDEELMKFYETGGFDPAGHVKDLFPETWFFENLKPLYKEVIDDYKAKNPEVQEILVISVLDTAMTEWEWRSWQHERILVFNEMLQELCMENGYTYVDATALAHEQDSGGDGITSNGDFIDDIHFSYDFCRIKLLPFLKEYVR